MLCFVAHSSTKRAKPYAHQRLRTVSLRTLQTSMEVERRYGTPPTVSNVAGGAGP
jgi:hypothetical protein